MILRYPFLAGVPPGGSQPYVDATALIAFGRLYHTHYNALAYSFLSVARVLPLLHVPRFPFHDSTGFLFCCKTNRKPYIFANKGVPDMSLKWASLRDPSGPPRRLQDGTPEVACPGSPEVFTHPPFTPHVLGNPQDLHCAHGASRCSHKLTRPISTGWLTQVQANS